VGGGSRREVGRRREAGVGRSREVGVGRNVMTRVCIWENSGHKSQEPYLVLHPPPAPLPPIRRGGGLSPPLPPAFTALPFLLSIVF
jgi:hypothetical protein